MEIEWNIAKNANTNTTFGPDPELPWDGHYEYDQPTIDPHYLRIKTLLDHVDADLDYDDWKRVIHVIHLETDGADEGFGLAIEWSGRSAFGRDHDYIMAVWGYEDDLH